jgi:hypothetical protein
MALPALEVGYTLATTGRGDHEVHKGHVVALATKKMNVNYSQSADMYIGIYLTCFFCDL